MLVAKYRSVEKGSQLFLASLHRWTRDGSEAAKDTAISLRWPKNFLTAFTFIEELTILMRHRFRLLELAVRTSNDRCQFHFIHFEELAFA